MRLRCWGGDGKNLRVIHAGWVRRASLPGKRLGFESSKGRLRNGSGSGGISLNAVALFAGRHARDQCGKLLPICTQGTIRPTDWNVATERG